jgi:NodT family efflux transporter outer membrane factor (OMF) lipoprotein
MASSRRTHFWRETAVLTAALGVVAFGGCTIGPKYVRPTAPTPAAYKEPGQEWKVAAPSDAINKGVWWEIYQDPQLNALEDQLTAANQSLKAAEDQFAAARAAVRAARSNYFPNFSVSPSAAGVGQSQNKALYAATGHQTYADYQIPFDVSYEPDLWGRVRQTVESARAQAQSSGADVANVALSMHAELAFDYFDLRSMDSQTQLLQSTVDSYTKALSLTQALYNGGLSSAVDVAQAQTQLETTRAQLIDVGVQRSDDEHAIAVLVGRPASDFKIDPIPLAGPPPPVPTGLPSDLLERRPDIAANERLVASQNALIGVAQTAYFPDVFISGGGGFDSAKITTLLQGPAGFWSLAGSAAETIFDGGARRAAVQEARANYDQSVDNYRQNVLTAFQEVEDNLAALRILQTEATTQDGAVAAAQRSLSLSETRYRGGVTNYLEVTTAQSAALSDERTAVTILSRRMAASVLLVKALGGGWNVSQMPAVSQFPQVSQPSQVSQLQHP